MNIGYAYTWGTMPCASTHEYADLSCNAITSAGNFILKRTHTLSTGNVLWDVGGNEYEVMKDLSTAGRYTSSGIASSMGNDNPFSDALGTAKDAFGLESVIGFSLSTSPNSNGGLGGFLGGSTNSSSVNHAVLRGGSFYDQNGVFHADIGWATATTTDGSYSFRCVYQ